MTRLHTILLFLRDCAVLGLVLAAYFALMGWWFMSIIGAFLLAITVVILIALPYALRPGSDWLASARKFFGRSEGK